MTEKIVDRTHEECADCIRECDNPPACEGHCEGPSHCSAFVAKSKPEVASKHKVCECGQQSVVCINESEGKPMDQHGWCSSCCQRDMILGKRVRSLLTPEKILELFGI